MATVDKFQLLMGGELSVTGRLVDASNATLYATLNLDSETLTCIYKPIAGERPLWDFPDGSLAHREYAAYLVSEAFRFNIVPMTVLRDGPYGFGMVQEWISIDEEVELAEFFLTDNPSLRSMALFDAVINNTDRKIGHLLPMKNGQLYGCDHGVTFHVEDKLRTVLWQWSGMPLTTLEQELLQNGRRVLEQELDLTPYLTVEEISALHMRIERLIESGLMPTPNTEWPAVPWPAF
jgi:uncharacterized repeat protein (TIGR03843 family)